jgi:hypothetical protein
MAIPTHKIDMTINSHTQEFCSKDLPSHCGAVHGDFLAGHAPVRKLRRHTRATMFSIYMTMACRKWCRLSIKMSNVPSLHRLITFVLHTLRSPLPSLWSLLHHWLPRRLRSHWTIIRLLIPAGSMNWCLSLSLSPATRVGPWVVATHPSSRRSERISGS